MCLSELLEYVNEKSNLRVYSVSSKKQVFKGTKRDLLKKQSCLNKRIRKSGVSLFNKDYSSVINIEVS